VHFIYCNPYLRDMLQRSYIILIIGAALLISGIIISALWAESFAVRFMSENTILSDVSIRPSALVNTTIQVTDTSKPVSLAIHVERNNNNNTSGTGQGQQILNNTLRETVRNPNGLVMTSNEFTKQFFTTFKPDITGKYTITIYNLGNTTVSIGVLVGNLPFVGANNQVNVNFLGEIIAGIILTIAGIIVLIAGVIVLALDRNKRVSPDQTTSYSPSSTTATTATTNTQRIVLASWIDRFVAWLIDVVIVSIGLGILFALISIPFWAAVSQSFDGGSNYVNMASRNFGAPWFPYVISSIVFMAYWTYFESTSGQSIGKRVMHLRTTDLNGNTLDIKTAAIESFGKAFLLPFDVLLGWIFTNDKRQRIFNRVSDSVVVKLREAEGYDTSRNITYMKD
jgi:uncharacterized RDD family membrane protein YckC